MDDKEILLEQYKIAVEMADRTSARREGITKAFLLANSVIFTFLATTQGIFYEFLQITGPLLGIIISVCWAGMIRHYETLNLTQSEVIHEIENTLPLKKIYKDKWDQLKQGRKKKFYEELVIIFEEKLPWMFIIIYLILFFYGLEVSRNLGF